MKKTKELRRSVPPVDSEALAGTIFKLRVPLPPHKEVPVDQLVDPTDWNQDHTRPDPNEIKALRKTCQGFKKPAKPKQAS